MQHDYLQHYETLGVTPDCNWQELRRAYRALTRQWHPDRHAPGAGHVAAGERMTEINRAYEALERYYAENGALPFWGGSGDDVGTFSDTATNSNNTAGPATQETPTSAANAETYTAYEHEKTPAASSRHFVRSGLFALIAIAGFAYLYLDTQTSQNEHGDTTASGVSGSDEHMTVTAPAAHPGAGAYSVEPGYLTIGSSSHEVLALHGPPDTIENGVWHYGASRVLMANDTVITWHEHPAHPLRTKTGASLQIRGIKGITFGKGSSMAEVRAAQGEPARAFGNTWEYGASRVHFESGQVVSWYESPLAPLNIRR